MDKITFTPIVLKNQKPTDIRECYVEFFPDHIRYRAAFWADEPIINDDVDSGWEQVWNDYDIVAMRDKISGVEKSFTKDKKWGIYIIVSGFANDIKVYSRSQIPAQQLFDKIHQWLVPSPK